MPLISGRTTMSSRGQIVIPKALREAAGIAEGDAIEVVYDGHRLCLIPDAGDSGSSDARDRPHDTIIAETKGDYRVPGQCGSGGDPAYHVRPSKVWADRMRALASIEKLRPEFAGVDAEEILRQSREELERRAERWSE